MAAEAGRREPFLLFLERRWSRLEVWQAAEAAAPGLSALALSGTRPIGLLLPNLPAAVVALIACWLAGRTAAPVDGRRPLDQLHAWAEATGPAALITLDLASVFERARILAEAHPPCPLVIMPMADQLSTWKRLISPWLRGGGPAKRPEGIDILAWSALRSASGEPPAERAPAVLLPEGAAWEAPADPAAAWPTGDSGLLCCPLAERQALAALVQAWCGEGQLVLSPRLDERSLAKVRKSARPALEIGRAHP